MRSGRSTSTRISKVNDTSGAQVGAMTAMVRDSLTPITSPAARTPSGLPSPPRITTAKTTPIHAKICDGDSV